MPEATQPPVTASIGTQPYRTHITTPGHELVADEPTKSGGQDAGPNPYDLMLGALASCTAITLRMYADRKNWPLEHVEVEMAQPNSHAEDCQHCEEDNRPTLHITTRLHLTGDLSDDQRARLHQIAEKCPVHRVLAGNAAITTTLAEGSD
ncbi:MAG: OsmC family protein [Phycisphaeraceae bacterium]